jgi:WD repeat-containing protein 23
MSSPGSDETRNEPGEAPIWHPAREWLEEDEGDEDDLDYTVPSTTMETEDDWEDDDDVGNEAMGLGVSDGETRML